ncbi:hypothetical protein CRI93_03785 [Longimonas halophila]|uniref:Response regulatory domain-containing protein n=1 Tax=Longimonas halophila TaxID=1469170 RepID=A0A2H3NW12_9BACT|nr:hypothetical protein CRI93_03785 [Longimonas halophila]
MPATDETDPPPRILLVDRNDDMRYFVETCLHSNGLATWSIDQARTGAEAVRSLHREHQLAVIGDVASGQEPLAASLRSMRALHNIRVLKLHCWSTPPDWCDAALRHPFSTSDFHRVLSTLSLH